MKLSSIDCRLPGFLALLVLALFLSGCTPSQKSSYHASQGDKYAKMDDTEKAEIEYYKAIRQNLKNVRAMFGMGALHFAKGDMVRAFPFLEQTTKLDTNNLEARLMLGRVYQSANDPERAQGEAGYVLARDPGNKLAAMLLAQSASSPDAVTRVRGTLDSLKVKVGETPALQTAYAILALKLGKAAEAEVLVQRALGKDPGLGEAHMVLGNIYLLQNKTNLVNAEFEKAAQLATDKAMAKINLATHQIRVGFNAEARKLLDELAKERPHFLPGKLVSAQLYLSEAKYAEAAKEVDKILEGDKTNYEARILQGRIFLAKRELEASLQAFENMLRTFPRSPQPLYYLGQTYFEGNDLIKASASLSKAISMQPGYAEAILLLAQVNIKLGNYPAVISAMRELIQKNVELPSAYLNLGKAFSLKDDVDNALKTYSKFMELYPKDPNGPYQAALAFLRIGDRANARKGFERALDLAPEELKTWEAMVEMDLQDKTYDTIVAQAGKLIEKFPQAAPPRVWLGRVHLAQNNFEKCEAELLKALELEPQNTSVYMLLAQAYIHFKKDGLAVGKLNESLAKSPRNLAALMRLATLLELRGDFPKAAEAYEKALELDGAFAPTMNNLAYIYAAKLGKLDAALDLARKARELAPNNPNIADTLSWLLCLKGQYINALPLAREASSALPGNPEALLHLGLANYGLGNYAAARQAFDSALKLNPDTELKTEATKRLAVLDALSAPDEEGFKIMKRRLAEDAFDPVALVQTGRILDRRGQFAEALRAYEKATTSSPTLVFPIHRMAQIYSRQLPDPKKGIELARSARALAPEDPEIEYTYARLAYQTGDHKRSLSLLESAAPRLPKDPQVGLDFALALLSVGRIDEAESSLKSALGLPGPFERADEAKRVQSMVSTLKNPGTPGDNLRKAQAALTERPNEVASLMVLANAAHDKGDAKTAHETYEKILALYPFFTPAMKPLALSLAEKDDKRAYDLAFKARAANPEDPEITKLLGATSYRLKDFKAAVQWTTEASAKIPADPDVFYYLGMAQYQLRNKVEAKKALNHSVALNLEGKPEAEAKKVLAELK